MKVLVLSDSHGHESRVSEIIAENRDAGAIIFLGDGERDFENALAENNIAPYGSDRNTIVYQVKGNCDLFSMEAVTVMPFIGGIRFLVTHGHDQHVKAGTRRLAEEAGFKHCDAALYGHTHIKKHEVVNGITLINPGSAANGNYALLNVENGVITQYV